MMPARGVEVVMYCADVRWNVLRKTRGILGNDRNFFLFKLLVPGGESIPAILNGHRENTTFKLRSRPGRESHDSVVLDPAQGKLADAPLQGEVNELRLGGVRRKDFHVPAAQVLN
jgi:hypothetical protein